MKNLLDRLQPLGRALMLPIAVLPVAGLLLRLGQPDLLDIPFIAAAGAGIFNNLGLLFAIGIAVGFARDGNGAAGLAGIVCFIVSTHGAQALLVVPEAITHGLSADLATLAEASWRERAVARLSVPMGILSGLIAGTFYNRYANIRLPAYLAFFGGKRFVPILSGLAGLGIALIFGLGYASIAMGVDALSRAVVASGPFGPFVFGLLNRLLVITGLHHILNNVAWFIIGDYHGATGDLNRFFAGDPTAGAFMSGAFPVMMFGLPAACYAMYRGALPERRQEVGGMLLSMALTSALTGVTEPIEFTFMFLAPLLYGLHAVMMGVAMALMDILNVRLGFGFSAGLFDYLLNYGKATRPLLLLPVGLAYALLYYWVFRFAILRFDLKTPGREKGASAVGPEVIETGGRGSSYIAALGGAANLTQIAACTTRLRLNILDQGVVDEPRLRALGAKGLVRLSDHDLQVVIGPEADLIASEMRAAVGPLAAPAAVPSATGPVAASDTAIDPNPWLAALGGRENVKALGAAHSRLWVSLTDPGRLQQDALRGLGVRMFIDTHEEMHLIVPAADKLADALQSA